MESERLNEIINHFLDGKATDEEKQLLHQWYNSFYSQEVIVPADSPDEKAQTEKKLLARIQETIQAQESRPKPNPFRLPAIYRVAASVLLVLGLGLGSFYLWRQFQLSEPTVAYQEIYNSAGRQQRLVLSDGSTVYLNAGTRFRFPKQFTSHTRQVYLEGEAFFEVTKHPHKPFIVHTGKLRTRVLGTSFNVRAYPADHRAEVAVLTGKVGVSDSLTTVVLQPNQKASYELATRRLRQEDIPDGESYRAWTRGHLVFDGRSLEEIIRTLSRHYNVPIRLANRQMGSCVLKAKFDKEPLDRVLTILCTYIGARYRREANEIIISGNGC